VVILAARSSLRWLAHRNHKSLAEVKNQVKNAHSTNLRDDLDRAIAGDRGESGNDVQNLRRRA
jgi:hypothetical protein